MNALIVYFDGDCGVCHSWVQFIIKRDKHAYFNFASLQSDLAKKQLPEHIVFDLNTLVFQHDKNIYVKSQAIAGICARLGFPYNLLALTLKWIPLKVSDYIYDKVASRRKHLSQALHCSVLKPQDKTRFLDL